jgi:hypothetical protein
MYKARTAAAMRSYFLVELLPLRADWIGGRRIVLGGTRMWEINRHKAAQHLYKASNIEEDLYYKASEKEYRK